MTVASPVTRPQLYACVEHMPWHPDVLEHAQRRCAAWNWHGDLRADVQAAKWYFIACWMSRQGFCGTDQEFEQRFSKRYGLSGGSSLKRYNSAVADLTAWGDALRKCEFDCIDAFKFIARCRDEPGVGIYVDSPWPDVDTNYTYTFARPDYTRLATALSLFELATIVIRYGDHPLIRDLYRESDGWKIEEYNARPMRGRPSTELLISKRAAEGG